jgi:2-keto-3-deoxy-L-rhamnonate aldolase RhmA
MIDPKSVRTSLADGNPVFGAWVQSMSPRIVETLGGTDLDWVGIDMEHTPTNFETAERLVRAADAVGLDAFVRVPSVEYAVQRGAQQALDIGATGLIVPRIEKPADVQSVVDAASFPPEGTRGVAGSIRANRHGTNFEGYVATANDDLVIVAQLETSAGIDNVGDIVGVDGVDVCFVGENDLSASLGRIGEKQHSAVQKRVERVRESAVDAGVVPGIAGRTPGQMSDRIEEGYGFFLLGGDLTFVRRGVSSLLPRR